MPTRAASPNRFSRNNSDFRVSHTDSESSFLASLNWCGIAAESDYRIIDWSSVRCPNCRAEFSLDRADAPIIGPCDTLPTTECPKCGGDAAPRAFLPDLVLSREKRIVIEISGGEELNPRPRQGRLLQQAWSPLDRSNQRDGKGFHGGQGSLSEFGLAVTSNHPERLFSPESG